MNSQINNIQLAYVFMF